MTLVGFGCSSAPVASPNEAVKIDAPIAPSAVERAAPPPVSSKAAPPRLATGDSHVCNVGADGKVYCWGDNDYGQLGDGTTDSRGLPVEAKGLSDVVAVAAGGLNTCALDRDHRVWCWGGIHNPVRSTPAKLEGLDKVRSLSVGDYHACAALENGKVWCWGQNYSGQRGSTEQFPKEDVPSEVSGVSDIVEVATGHSVSCALQSNGSVWCWGKNGDRSSSTPVRVEGLPPVRAIRLTWEQACALDKSDKIHCWGQSTVGHDYKNPAPTEVPGLADVADFDVGAFDLCAAFRSGDVSCMSTGGGSRSTKLSGYSGYLVPKAREVSGGNGFMCVRGEDGSVRCHGNNGSGQLGIGERGDTRIPSTVSSTDDAIDVVPAWAGGCALYRDQRVQCWGAGHRLGENEIGASSPEPVAIAKAKHLFAGWTNDETCAVTVPGDLFCFPSGRPDHAGRGSAPEKVTGLRDVVQVEPYGYRTRVEYAVVGNGDLFVTTSGNDAKSGTRKLEATRVVSAGKVKTVATSTSDACVVRKTGKVACWHIDMSEGADIRKEPELVEIPTITNAVEVANGTHWCARTASSEVYCWSFGEKKTGKPELVKPPLQQPKLSGAKAMWKERTLAFQTAGGEILRNSDARGGAGWGSDGLIPLYPSPYEAATLVRARSLNVCLLQPKGGVACWGSNDGNALGSSDRMLSVDPVVVKLPNVALAPAAPAH